MAFEELAKKAGLKGDEQLAASDLFLDGILESESKRLGLPVKMTRKGLAAGALLVGSWLDQQQGVSQPVSEARVC